MIQYSLHIRKKNASRFTADNYIQNILQNQKAADDFIDAVEEKYLTILKEPHLQPNEWVNNRLYYGALVKKYIIAYYIDEPTKTVVITAVRHTRQKRKYF